MTHEGRRWACIHDKKPAVEGAPEPCGKVAFYSLVPVVRGMIVRHEDFEMPDGSKIMPSQAVTCGGCDAFLDMRYAQETLTILEEQ